MRFVTITTTIGSIERRHAVFTALSPLTDLTEGSEERTADAAVKVVREAFRQAREQQRIAAD